MSHQIHQADWQNPVDRDAVAQMIGVYYADPFGNHTAMDPERAKQAVEGLAQTPHAACFLATVNKQPAGYALCMFGFSSFQAKPVLNLHDLAVHPDHRGQGVGRALVQHTSDFAEAQGCCKLTLEVLATNHNAQALYQSEGIVPSEPSTWFWSKPLNQG